MMCPMKFNGAIRSYRGVGTENANCERTRCELWLSVLKDESSLNEGCAFKVIANALKKET